jgi:hypothetical protein
MAAGLGATAAPAATCSPSEIAASATALQDSRFALSLLPPHQGATTAITLKTGSAIAQIKTSLAAFITAYMNCQHANADAQGIQVDLSRLGWARTANADTPSPAPSGVVGPEPILTFEVRSFPGGLLGVTATFGIPCGNDTLLMLFRSRENVWAELMSIQSGHYHDLARAYRAFDYALSPLGDDGGWFLVEKHQPVSCGSPTGTLEYTVLQPGPWPLHPVVLFNGRDGIAVGGDADLDADADGFRLRLRAADGTATGDVRRFTVSGGTVRPDRQPPQN